MIVDFCEQCGQIGTPDKPVKMLFLREFTPPWKYQFDRNGEAVSYAVPVSQDDALELCTSCQETVRQQLKRNKRYRAAIEQKAERAR